MDERPFPRALSAADSLLWRIESDPVLRSPVVVVALLDRSPTAERLRATIERAAAVMPRLRQRIVNLVVTNVPGPSVPLYFAGARMLEAFPAVPLGANLSVGVAVLSYDGALAISLTGDDLACPDLDVLAAGIERSLAQHGVTAREARVPREPVSR